MEQRMLVRETEQGAYLGPGPELEAAAITVAATPHFDVFDWGCRRLILGKCSRLPDDEDQVTKRYGIDFHRSLPPFKGSSGFWCDWGTGPIEVNAYTYARHLPKTLQFREFTANLAFAASTEEAYQAKYQVYQDFYSYLFNSYSRIILASPHSGEVRRPPTVTIPFHNRKPTAGRPGSWRGASTHPIGGKSGFWSRCIAPTISAP
jgi:hypothetical protein